jgi:hypothetical protein
LYLNGYIELLLQNHDGGDYDSGDDDGGDDGADIRW